MTTGAGGGPANMLSLNVGGIAVNYDLGPSVATVASQAYSFLNNSFDNDTSLLTGAIAGANKMVTGITTPVIDLATEQQKFNTTQLPTLFAQLENQNFQTGQSAQQVQAATAESSIAASNAEAANAPKGGGGCYITTAACEAFNLKDDCYVLNTLRGFRDSYMRTTMRGNALVREYYETAPAIVAALKARVDGAAILRRLFTDYLWRAVCAIEAGRNELAQSIYCDMVADVREEVYGH